MSQSKKHFLNQEYISKANEIINDLKSQNKLIDIDYDLMVKEANQIILELKINSNNKIIKK